jgi:hypothetical protein
MTGQDMTGRKTRLAINGFGRIGRTILRILAQGRHPDGAPWESLQYYPLRDFWRDGKRMISA